MIPVLYWLGLGFNIIGVIMLVIMVDRDLKFIIKNMNRVVGDDWDDKVKKILEHKRLYSGVGIMFLVGGSICEYLASILFP